MALDGAALGGQGQTGADLQDPTGPLLLLVGAHDDAGALKDLLPGRGDRQRRATESGVQLAGEEVAHGQAPVGVGQQVGLVEQLQTVQVSGHVHVDARGRGVGVGLDTVDVQEPAGGRPVTPDDRLVGGVGASVEGVEVADEVGQEAVAGLVVVDAARAAALAIPVATVTTPVTASAPVVPVGTASLAALSHDGNPTHPLIRVPAAAARTTPPPGHPQVPPTATWWTGVLRFSWSAEFRAFSAGRPGRRSGRRRRAPWPGPRGRGRRPARRRRRRSRC